MNESKRTISKIPGSTLERTFYAGLDGHDGTIKIFKGASEVSQDAKTATGMVAKLYYQGNVVKEYTIIVTGDVNGDGNISITDIVTVNNSLLGKKPLTGVYVDAADVDNNGKVTITDIVKINNKLLGKSNIDPH